MLGTSGALSYGELLARARAAAGWLRGGHGVGRDELVGLIMRRGPEQIVGILAALLAGGAYLPVDAALPAERIGYMLRDGRVRRVLTNSGWTGGGDNDHDRDGPAVDVLELDATGPVPAPRSRCPTRAPTTSPTCSTPPARPASPRA